MEIECKDGLSFYKNPSKVLYLIQKQKELRRMLEQEGFKDPIPMELRAQPHDHIAGLKFLKCLLTLKSTYDQEFPSDGLNVAIVSVVLQVNPFFEKLEEDLDAADKLECFIHYKENLAKIDELLEMYERIVEKDSDENLARALDAMQSFVKSNILVYKNAISTIINELRTKCLKKIKISKRKSGGIYPTKQVAELLLRLKHEYEPWMNLFDIQSNKSSVWTAPETKDELKKSIESSKRHMQFLDKHIVLHFLRFIQESSQSLLFLEDDIKDNTAVSKVQEEETALSDEQPTLSDDVKIPALSSSSTKDDRRAKAQKAKRLRAKAAKAKRSALSGSMASDEQPALSEMASDPQSDLHDDAPIPAPRSAKSKVLDTLEKTKSISSSVLEQMKEFAPLLNNAQLFNFGLDKIRNAIFNSVPEYPKSDIFDKVLCPEKLDEMRESHPQELYVQTIYEDRESENHGKSGALKDCGVISSKNPHFRPRTSEMHLVCDGMIAITEILVHNMAHLLREMRDNPQGKDALISELVDLVGKIFDQVTHGFDPELQFGHQLLKDYIQQKTRRLCENASSIAELDNVLCFIRKEILDNIQRGRCRAKLVCEKDQENTVIFAGDVEYVEKLDHLMSSGRNALWAKVSIPEDSASNSGAGYLSHDMFAEKLKGLLKDSDDSRLISPLNLNGALFEGKGPLAKVKSKILNKSPDEHLRVLVIRNKNGLIISGGSGTYSSSALGQTKAADGLPNGKGRIEMQYVLYLKMGQEQAKAKMKEMKTYA